MSNPFNKYSKRLDFIITTTITIIITELVFEVNVLSFSACISFYKKMLIIIVATLAIARL